MIAGWAVLDQFVIEKGLGHYDFEELLQKLIGNIDEESNTLTSFPRAKDDIGGGDMVGVEADAAWEAIYQGLISPEQAALVHAGPRPGLEREYRAALDAAIAAGAPTINQAIEIQNQQDAAKHAEKLTEGTAEQDLIPIPPAFQMDLGKAILTEHWKNGVWGPMNKKHHWQEDEWNRNALRIGNRDKDNKFPESWARPYSKGLKEIRGGQATKDYIESHRVQPHGVYIDIEAKNMIYDLMDNLLKPKEQGGGGFTKQTLTPDILKQHWQADNILNMKQPHQNTPLQQIYNIRTTHPNVAASTDHGEAQVDAQQAPEDPLAHINYFLDDPDLITSKHGRSLLGQYTQQSPIKYGGVWSNKNIAGAIYQNWMNKYGEKLGENRPSMQDLADGQKGGGFGERLMRGLHDLQQGGFPQPAQPPAAPEGAPLGPVVNRPPPEPVQQAPPVPQNPLAPPIPANQPAPPIPQQLPPQHLNANQLPPSPPSHPDESLEQRRGWRGMADRVAEALGRGAGHAANIFTREEIENALESVQIDLAMQEDTIIKMKPHTPMSGDNAAHIAFVAGQVQRPSSDVVTILNSRGDWREMAKSMDIPIEIIQVVKVAFQ